MLIKKKINFALEFRRKGTKKNGNNEVNQENLPLRMRVSYNRDCRKILRKFITN